jgi:predicted Rossmann fold flavoprotein
MDNLEQVYQELRQIKLYAPKRKIANSSQYRLPHRLWHYLLEISDIGLQKLWSEVSNNQLYLLAKNLTKSSYHLGGKGVFKEEFVTCGGVSLKQVNLKSMESRICPNIYFAGEILDIDGITGGFNLQSAWTTGYIAGLAISKCS